MVLDVRKQVNSMTERYLWRFNLTAGTYTESLTSFDNPFNATATEIMLREQEQILQHI